ncbi:MAG: cysteine synthase A [Bacillota bacterium]|nr:cysteine synthase A [Bacillota bacterium]
MGKLYKNLTELIGNTPLVELTRLEENNKLSAKILAKIEYFNPAGSVKDRVGFAMIEDGEKKGIINKDTVIIEPTSGNTGVGLAFVAAAKGYKLILTMPDSMSIERRKILKAYGAEVVLTPGAEGMKGAIKKAEELAASIPNSFIPQQFENPSNADAHRKTTAEEIWDDTEGKVDILVAGVGTGGTITGVGEVLKSKNPELKVVAVEPYTSPILSGGKPGPHKLQGIGANFIPEILNMDIIDEIFKVRDQEAYDTTRNIVLTEGLFVGISSGAALFAAVEIAKRPENVDKNIVVILPDTGQRYLSMSVFD